MDAENMKKGVPSPPPYLTAVGAWALAFGCSVGWGSFVMPGTTFLPIAGPAGTAIGLGVGALVMLIIGMNFHYLMNRYPEAGGTYTYTKNSFGYDHGFLSAWFLVLTYIAIIWANATALPLIARTLLGSTFQVGLDYEVAGFHVYFGEILLAIASLLIAAIVCLRRKAAEWTQIVMAVLLFAGIVICFTAATGRPGNTLSAGPSYMPGHYPLDECFTIFALAPWAYVGFESITHSAAEAKFSLKHSFAIMAAALVAAGLAYMGLSLLAVTALPSGCSSWIDYVGNLGTYGGIASQPTFFAAFTALGHTGSVILGIAALCAIFTGLIGNYIALSRLLSALSGDGLLPGWIGKTDKNHVPQNAILSICAVSLILPFFGRTAISWIVDVTTVGATIAYAFASASAWKEARMENNRIAKGFGMAGLVISLLFALEFLVPNMIAVKTLSTESYLILAVWGILGFIVFRTLLKRDTGKRLGRSTVAWIVLLGLIIFTSTVWMMQSVDDALSKTAAPIQEYYEGGTAEADAASAGNSSEDSQRFIINTLGTVNSSLDMSIAIQMVLIVTSLLILFDIYSRIQKRERQTEVEKMLAEEASKAKTSFLSNMSHEIRTPMNAIIGLDSIALRNPNLQPKTREQLEKIGASARHLLALINDILDMSRIESGRMVLKSEEFYIRDFLDQINIMINGQCVDKGLNYECNIVGQLHDYYIGDDMKLKQVLINILGNAVKFTDAPGDVIFTVEQIAEEEDVCTLRFIMKDTGAGMDEEYLPKIFEAFSQEDATATNRYGGSGLGMAITKNFVEMMGGDIHVESKKGVGSQFTVTVKLKASDRTFDMDEDLQLPKGMRGLVVDDDKVSCEHAQMILGAVGVSADITLNPEEGLKMLREAYDRKQPYTFVLTDYKMPSMNGLELTRELRKFDGGETEVIMLTGYNWDIIEDEAYENGIDSILAKPLFPESLLKEIYAISKRRAGKEDELSSDSGTSDSASDGILQGRRVLMAEDVEQNAEILEDLLDLEDIESEHAVNGEVAVRMFSEKPEGYYDAILMDVRMPVMDGLTATKTIRALDRPDAKTIPIIAMTANVFDEDVERSREAGMNAHLSKPVEPDKLYETMKRLIAAE